MKVHSKLYFHPNLENFSDILSDIISPFQFSQFKDDMYINLFY